MQRKGEKRADTQDRRRVERAGEPRAVRHHKGRGADKADGKREHAARDPAGEKTQRKKRDQRQKPTIPPARGDIIDRRQGQNKAQIGGKQVRVADRAEKDTRKVHARVKKRVAGGKEPERISPEKLQQRDETVHAAAERGGIDIARLRPREAAHAEKRR